MLSHLIRFFWRILLLCFESNVDDFDYLTLRVWAFWSEIRKAKSDLKKEKKNKPIKNATEKRTTDKEKKNLKHYVQS